MKRFLIFLSSILAIILVVLAFYFLPTKTTAPTEPAEQSVKLYYYNLSKDKASSNNNPSCDAKFVLPLERKVLVTDATPEKTIKLLLKGELSQEELAQGYATEFPHQGFELLASTLANNVLTLQFPEIMGFTSGGSCRIGLLRAQIEKTAQQFSDVKEVKFLPEEIFQP